MRLSDAAIVGLVVSAGCGTVGMEGGMEGGMDPDSIHPAATGLLIVTVAPGSQAAERGVERGDILVAYGDAATPDAEALDRAKKAAEKEKREAVRVEVVREGKALTFDLEPGTLGVRTVPVVKDTPLSLRPAATGVEYDFSRLEAKPLDNWYSFHIGGRHVGFEHTLLELDTRDGKLILTREVAFDYGKEWGIQHFLVTVTAEAAPQPKALSGRFELPASGHLCEGRLVAGEGGMRWESVLTWPEEEEEEEDGKTVERRETKRIDSPPADLMPSYLIGELSAFMPREAGACFHYTMLTDGTGDVENPGALYAARGEDVEVEGKTVRAMRFECRSMGGTGNVAWVDEAGRIVKQFYGQGVEAFLTTKERALEGLTPEIKPRTAGPTHR